MPPIARRRKALFFAILALLSVLAVEALATVALVATSGGWLSIAQRRTERAEAAGETGRVRRNSESRPRSASGPGTRRNGRAIGSSEVIHPFLGFVQDPNNSPDTWRTVNSQGFFEPINVAKPEPPSRPFRIGIFGGSVADQLSFAGRERLSERLAALAPSGEPVWIETYAMGGYKQPQQLMTLSYLLATGQAPDLVINLDGFNEVVLPVVDNLRLGTNPFYPRFWSGRAKALPELSSQSAAGEVSYLDQIRRQRSHLCDGVVSWSASCHVLWRALDRPLGRRQYELRTRLASLERADRSFFAQGPEVAFKYSDSPEVIYPNLVDLWIRSSVAMADLCRGQDIPYFHFLQPNQYVEGSKPMGNRERQRAIREDFSYRKPAERGYPYLIAAGDQLRTQGVNYFDLTMIFEQVAEPLYSDSCCHLNREGNLLLADAIADRIVDEVAPSSPKVSAESAR